MRFPSSNLERRALADDSVRVALVSWALALLLAISSWGLSLWINRTCAFVRIHQTNQDGSTVEFGRGIQQGQLLPLDECMGWGRYGDLTLDSRMTTARAASALSVVAGAITIVLLFVYLFLGRPCMSFCCKWAASVLSLTCAVMQVLTHLMVSSSLCQGAQPGEGDATEDGFATEMTCTANTPSYRATFYNIVAWAIAAVIVAIALPVQRVNDGLDSNGRHREEGGSEKLDETCGDDMEHVHDDEMGLAEA